MQASEATRSIESDYLKYAVNELAGAHFLFWN